MKTIIINSPKYGRFEVLVDDEDYDRAKDINWIIFFSKKRQTQYATRYVEKIKDQHRLNGQCKDRYEWMHHFIMGREKGKVIDHIDRNGLNNQKSNLRICTQSQNILNQRIRINNASGFKGVHLCKRENKWVAAISINGKKKFLGYFKTAEEAHDVWMKKSKEIRGEFHTER